MKPFFNIDIAQDSQSSLEAHLPLALTSREGCYHEARNFRLPLGIYNESVSRTCDKIIRLCNRLEQYFMIPNVTSSQSTDEDLMQEVIDYLELSLYSAAEHVNDIESIASGYFMNKDSGKSNSDFRLLLKQINKHKKLVSSAANAIKHQQARVRIFSMDYSHLGQVGCLHGYFIEGVKDGVICPSPIFHQVQEVFSITALVWEILVFMLECSRDLSIFLNKTPHQFQGPAKTNCPIFSKAIVAASKLPLYTFGELHPFTRATVSVYASNGDGSQLKSALYGSLTNRWIRWGQPIFGKFIGRFAGDGVTKTFQLPKPKTVAFSHWT